MSVSIQKSGIVSASGSTVNPNLLVNSDFHSTYQQTTGWDTAKNGTTLAISWGGYNGGVSNPSTVYHAHMKQFDGEWVYEYIRDANNSWLGVSQGGLQSVIQPNTTYTWSIDEYRVNGSNNYITAGIYYKLTSDGSNGFHSGCPNGTANESGYDKWIRRYYTFTTGNVYTGAGISFYIYGHAGGSGTVYMRRPKLEIGSVPTPWCLSESEGIVSESDGFVEYPVNNSIPRIYKNIVETKDFIEW